MNTISVKDKSFIDNNGRERIFNGVNIVYKGCLPDEDGVVRFKTDISDEMLSALAKKGIDIIRFGITWAGIEPQMGVYNNEYLDGVKNALKLCEKHSIYAFLDWHQDLFSYYCYDAGDGAPKWAAKNSPEPKKPFLIWATGYFFGKRVHKSFDAFWDNEPIEGRGIQDRFCDMLTYTAEYLKDCKAIMGYDILNEPFPGTPGGKIFRKIAAGGMGTILFDGRVDRKKLIKDAKAKDVMSMLTVIDRSDVYHAIIDNANKLLYKFDTEKYYPFLQKAAFAIRKTTPEGIIFSENCYYSNLGIPCSVPNLVYKDGTKEPNFAFAPHGYDITVDTPLTNEASPNRVDHIFGEHERTQERLGIPVLVGEWGGMVPGGEKYPALQHLIDKFDKNKWSQTYWHWFKDMPDSKIMDIISRPLPQAVAGTIKKYEYDKNLDTFTLTYSGSSKIKAPTLIYLHKEPKAVYSTKKYRMINTDGALMLQVSAGKGECIVKVEF